MGKIGVVEIIVILAIIAFKFAVIIGTVIWVKNHNEKKKQMFLQQEELRKASMNASNPDIQ